MSSLKKNPIIYQVSTRPWLLELSKEYNKELKTLADIPEEVLKKIKSDGFDYLYLLGIWEIGQYGLNLDRSPENLKEYLKVLPDCKEEDAIGCPFAVVDYIGNKELCPNGDSDIINFKKKINDIGLKLMLDFIPNHSAYDSPWVKENIDMYIRVPKDTPKPYDKKKIFENGIYYAGIQVYFWPDVAQLNYWNPDTRKFMTEKLTRVASLSDGIRVDVAMAPLNSVMKETWEEKLEAIGYKMPETEFWTEAIKAVKAKYPNTVLLAEVYGPAFKELIAEGFDFCYDQDILDKMKGDKLEELKEWIIETGKYASHMSRFLENHDFNRAVDFFKGDIKKTICAAVVAYTLPGMRFLFQDYFNGYKNKLEIHLRRSYKEEKSKEMKEFYDRFMPIISEEVFKEGEWKFINVKESKLLCWEWSLKDERRLVVVNFSDKEEKGKIAVGEVSGEGKIQLQDLLSQKEVSVEKKDLKESGWEVSLEKYTGKIFSFKK